MCTIALGHYNNESEYGDCRVEWNPDGNAMNFMDLKVPILSLYNEAEVWYQCTHELTHICFIYLHMSANCDTLRVTAHTLPDASIPRTQ